MRNGGFISSEMYNKAKTPGHTNPFSPSIEAKCKKRFPKNK